jgi:ATP-dependent DNA helicase RecG
MDTLLEKILNIPEETQEFEFKRLGGAGVVKKVAQTVVAMANTDGGVIVLGVEDPEKTKLKGLDRVFGIEEKSENYDEIKREIGRIDPKGSITYSIKEFFVDSIKRTWAILFVEKNTSSLSSIDNDVYIRGKKSNIKIGPHEIINYSYARGYKTFDSEVVNVDFDLLDTATLDQYFKNINLLKTNIANNLYDIGLAKKNAENEIKPTLAAVMLFADHPTFLTDVKCAVKIYKYKGTLEKFEKVPNTIGVPKIIEGSIIEIIKKTQEYVLDQLASGVEFKEGFVNKYRIPERAVQEAIVNAVIHRDYFLKRDIEISIFEDRIEFLSPGLFVDNITTSNIGHVRSNKYRNDLLVKHLRQFPVPPNLDRNEGVRAMRDQMKQNNLYPPIFITYPLIEDSVKVVLLNELIQTEWQKIEVYLKDNTYITNEKAREITGITQRDTMSIRLRKWVEQGLLIKVSDGAPKFTKYRLSSNTLLENLNSSKDKNIEK